MSRKVIPQHRKKKRYVPKHRVDGTFKKPKLGKYNAKGRHVDGHWFASGAEADRYELLKEMVEDGKISRLELQPTYPIQIDGHPICTYRADFRYFKHEPNGAVQAIIVEDVKGMRTEIYMLKKKLVEAKHRIKIYEVPAKKIQLTAGLTADEVT